MHWKISAPTYTTPQMESVAMFAKFRHAAVTTNAHRPLSGVFNTPLRANNFKLPLFTNRAVKGFHNLRKPISRHRNTHSEHSDTSKLLKNTFSEHSDTLKLLKNTPSEHSEASKSPKNTLSEHSEGFISTQKENKQ